MTVAEVLAAFGDLTDDLGQTPLWSTSVRLRFLREAQIEACRRARLLRDQDKDEVSLISLVAQTGSYDVDPRVIFIRRVKWSGADRPLVRVHPKWLDECFPGWEGHDAGVPQFWALIDRRLVLYPAPEDVGTVRLDVVREPLADPAVQDLTAKAISTLSQVDGLATAVLAAPSTLATGRSVIIAGADQAEYNGAKVVTVLGPSIITFGVPVAAVSPATGTTITYLAGEYPLEIRGRHQDKLVDWMLWRALSMRDKEEKYDQAAADAHLAVFEEEFGKRSAAIDEVWIEEQHGYDESEGLF